MRVPEMTSYEIITRIDGPTNSHAYTKIQCPVTSMILMQASTSKKDCYCWSFKRFDASVWEVNHTFDNKLLGIFPEWIIDLVKHKQNQIVIPRKVHSKIVP